MRNNNNKVSKTTYIISAVSISFSLLSAIFLIVAINNRSFAEWYSTSVSYLFRFVLSVATTLVPFSIAEVVVVLSPLLVVGLIVLMFGFRKRLMTIALSLLSVICVLATLFVNTFGICYYRQPMDVNMGLEKRALNRLELYNNGLGLADMVNDAAEKVTFDDSGASINPHSKYELDKLLIKGYDKLHDREKFIANIPAGTKRIALSKLMTYTHISGIYIPFTGEANVNCNYPDYVVAFTTAHEMAHQRGIAGEDEANFAAFLACMESGDDYLKYSALLSMYDYHLDASLIHDRDIYISLVESTNKEVLGEMYAYYLFFEKYRNSKASDVAETVNDSYIKTMGDDEGVKSYGKVVELYDAYVRKYG